MECTLEDRLFHEKLLKFRSYKFLLNDIDGLELKVLKEVL